MRFTMQRLEALECPAGKREALFWDEDLPGFGIRVTDAGGKGFLVQYRSRAGVSRRMALGKLGIVTLDAARKRARALLVSVAEGADPVAQRREAEDERKALHAITLGALIDSWTEKHLADASKSYRREAPRALRHAFAADLGKPAAVLTKARIIVLLDALPATMARRTVHYGSALFGWAVERDMLPTNPFVGVKAGKVTVRRDRVLTDAELCAIWIAAEADTGRYGAIVRLLLLTGARREEIAGMAWDEIAGDLWTLPASRSKNGQAHILPLPSLATAIIAAQPRISDQVFGGFSGWSKSKSRIDKDSGVTGWRLHDLRRTCATGLQGLGVRLEVTEAVLNHISGSQRGIVSVYQRHNWADEKRGALAAWAQRVESLVSGKTEGGNVVEMRRA